MLDKTQSPLRYSPAVETVETDEAAVDDGMAFNPWHGLAAHQPLGSIMRVRKLSYDAIRRFRAEKNGRSIDEPRELGVLPN